MYRLTLQRFWGKELNTTCTLKSKFTVLPKSNDSVKYSELKFIPGRKWVPLECNYTLNPCIIRHNTTSKQNNKLNCARTGSSIDRHLLILNELYSQRTFPNTAGCKRNKSAELGWKDQMFSAIGSNRHWKIKRSIDGEHQNLITSNHHQFVFSHGLPTPNYPRLLSPL